MSAATDAIGRCVFIGTLYELEVPSRDCHVASLLAMTRQGNARCTSALLPLNIPYKAVTDRRYTPYFGVCRFHGRLYGSEVRSRERTAVPYNARPKACVFFILHFSVFRIHFHAPAPLQRISGGPAKNSTLRVSRFLPQIFPFLCITACTGGETCCGEGQHAWNRSCAVCPTGPTRAR